MPKLKYQMNAKVQNPKPGSTQLSHLAFNHLDLICHLDFDIYHSKHILRTSEAIILLVR